MQNNVLHRCNRVRAHAAVFLAAACLAGPLSAQAHEELSIFSGVLNHVRLNYADTVTYAQLVRAAIDGVLRSLDPHSYYASRREYERLSALERGELGVTGLVLEEVDSVITVLAVRARSPAARARILPGDRLLRVNDTTVLGLQVKDVDLRLAGEKGSRVRLVLERGPRLLPDTFRVDLRRDFLRPESAVAEVLMLDSVTGFLRLREFGPKAGDEVHDALRRLRGQGARQLVLDLRGNPGGIVDQAVQVAGEFLAKGTLVFRTQGRKRDVNKEYTTDRNGDFRELPLVVLVDRRSASAAEALAGSLQDHDRAVIAGRRTFGKALMQTGFVVLPSYDLLILTVGWVVTPSGRVIQRRYRGLIGGQYWAFAGRSGAPEDTLAVFKTDAGREVRGGGGIGPDTTFPAPPDPPVWWSVAADSGFDVAVADSVATLLRADRASRAAWLTARAEWRQRLLEPFLVRVRARLRIPAQPDSAQAAQLEVLLAARAAEVRWPPDGGDELLLRNDPDILAAINLFPRVSEMLRPRAR
jgi:carboxyl-terminal processing protease